MHYHVEREKNKESLQCCLFSMIDRRVRFATLIKYRFSSLETNKLPISILDHELKESQRTLPQALESEYLLLRYNYTKFCIIFETRKYLSDSMSQ